jgi:hypothetical protein
MQTLICLGTIALLYGAVAFVGFSVGWLRERKSLGKPKLLP